MRVIVTGSSGQLGSYLLEELIQRHDVRGIDFRPPSIVAHQPVTLQGDIRDPGVLEQLGGFDAVVHLAAQVSVDRSLEDPLHDCDVNLTGTISLLKASSDLSAGIFVYVSSAAVYGNPVRIPVDEGHPTSPRSFYGASKLSAEGYARAFWKSLGLPFVIIRPFNIYSPRADPRSPYSGVIARFVSNAREGMPLVIEGDGEQTRDFVHARDVARMIRIVLESGVENTTINCGTGHGISINSLARLISSRSGVGVVHQEARRGDVRHSVADMSRARELLGYRAKIDIEEGMGDLL